MNNIDIDFVRRNVNATLLAKNVAPQDHIQRIWEAGFDSPRHITPYFENIGVRSVPDGVFRYHPDALRTNFDVRIPAIVAPIRDPRTGELAGLYLTYLETSGRARNSMVKPKIMMHRAGGVVRLAGAGNSLAICQSLETGLAFMEHRKIPTWCTLTAKGLKDFQIPPGVANLIRVDGQDLGVLTTKRTGQHSMTRPNKLLADIPSTEIDPFQLLDIAIKPKRRKARQVAPPSALTGLEATV